MPILVTLTPDGGDKKEKGAGVVQDFLFGVGHGRYYLYRREGDEIWAVMEPVGLKGVLERLGEGRGVEGLGRMAVGRVMGGEGFERARVLRK